MNAAFDAARMDLKSGQLLPISPGMKAKIAALINNSLVLPVAPQTLARLVASFDAPDMSVDAIARDISDDPVLTASLLKSANSAFFGLTRPVATPADAMRILGFTKVRGLVLTTAMRASFHQIPPNKAAAIWAVSLDAADIAMSLARMTSQDNATAYTCGMLHAVGMLVMHAAMPEAILALDRQVLPMTLERAEAERAQFGFCHAEAGAALAQCWGLPKRFADALEFQYTPLDNDRHEVLAAIVNLAGWRARADFCRLDQSEMATSYPDEVGLILNLDHDMMIGDIPGRAAVAAAPG